MQPVNQNIVNGAVSSRMANRAATDRMVATLNNKKTINKWIGKMD